MSRAAAAAGVYDAAALRALDQLLKDEVRGLVDRGSEEGKPVVRPAVCVCVCVVCDVTRVAHCQVLPLDFVIGKLNVHGVQRVELLLNSGAVKLPAPPWSELVWLVHN